MRLPAAQWAVKGFSIRGLTEGGPVVLALLPQFVGATIAWSGAAQIMVGPGRVVRNVAGRAEMSSQRPAGQDGLASDSRRASRSRCVTTKVSPLNAWTPDAPMT